MKQVTKLLKRYWKYLILFAFVITCATFPPFNGFSQGDKVIKHTHVDTITAIHTIEIRKVDSFANLHQKLQASLERAEDLTNTIRHQNQTIEHQNKLIDSLATVKARKHIKNHNLKPALSKQALKQQDLPAEQKAVKKGSFFRRLLQKIHIIKK